MEEQSDRWVSAKEARDIIEQALQAAGIATTFSFSKMMRILAKGEIPSAEGIDDRRKRIMRLSAVQQWIADQKRKIEELASQCDPGEKLRRTM